MTDTLVVDASAYVPMLILGRRPPGLDEVELTAPSLLWSESTSALAELVWRRELDRDSGLRALDSLDALGVVRRSPPGLLRNAYQLALTLGWAKTYDAEYVALARHLNAPLLTRDSRLARGASRLVTFYLPAES